VDGMNFESEDYKNLFAGMNEIFSESEIEQFKRNASSDSYATLGSGGTPKHEKLVKKQYKEHYDGQIPKNKKVLRDAADYIEEIEVLVSQIESSVGSLGTFDLRVLMKVNPDIGSDIGRLISLKEMIDLDRNQFGSDIQFKESWASFGKQFGESSAVGFKGVKEFVGSLTSSVGATSKGNYFGSFMHVAKGLAKFGLGTAVNTWKVSKSAGDVVVASGKKAYYKK